MHYLQRIRRILGGVAITITGPAALGAPVVYSTTDTGGPTNFGSLNWTPAGTPGTDALDVANFGSASNLVVSLNGSRALGSVGRTAGNTVTINQTSGSDSITLNSAGTSTTAGLSQAQLLKTSNGTLTINAPVVLGANGTWASTNTSNSISINGTLTDGVNTFSLRKIGAGTVTLNPGNGAIATGVTHDGGTRVEAGTLNWGDGSSNAAGTVAFGSGALDLAGGKFDIRWGGGFTLGNAIIGDGGTLSTRRGDGAKFNGGVALKSQLTIATGGGGGTPAFDVNSTVTLDQSTAGTRRLVSDVGGNGAGRISGNIVDGGVLENNPLTVRVITGRNLEFTGTANSYDGGTIIESAASGQTQRTLVIAAASQLGAGDVTVQAQGGTVPSFTSNGYGGMLQLNGNTNIASTATLTIETGGLVTLNYLNTLPGAEDTTDLLVSGLILGGVIQPTGVYNATSHPGFLRGTGDIVVVPEPATLGGLALGAFGLIRRRR